MPTPKKDWDRLRLLVASLKREPKTIVEIQAEFKLSRSSAYRWIEYLKEDETYRILEERRYDEPATYEIITT